MKKKPLSYGKAEGKNVTMKKMNETKLGKRAKRIYTSVCTALMCSSAFALSAGAFGEDVTINTNGSTDANELMGKIIGILLTITRFVGVALVVYGVYEVFMSYQNQQPEAKTKGIIMALSGVAMVALKSILSGIGIIS
jgi:hypothetical protein